MSDNQIKSGKSNRKALIALLGASALLLVVGFVGIAAWSVRHFMNEPEAVVIPPEEAAPPVAKPAPAPAHGFRPVGGGGKPQILLGKITDAVTHQPVGHLWARVGVSSLDSADRSMYYIDPPGEGSRGMYVLIKQINPSARVQYCVRVEANGYQPAVREWTDMSAAPDFELTPGQDLQGRVLGPDGAAIARATVALVLPGRPMIVADGNITGIVNSQVTTDADGKYDLPPESGPFLLAAIADAGHAVVDQDAVAKDADIHLSAWGGIAGVWKIGTTPASNLAMLASKAGQIYAQGPPLVTFSSECRTDSYGHFSFGHLAEAEYQVCREIGQPHVSRSITTDADLGVVKVSSGQTTTINLGGVGRPVEGKVVRPPGTTRSDYYLMATAKAKGGAVADAREYRLQIDVQDNFRIDDVPPGDYTITLRPERLRATQVLNDVVVEFTMPDVPGGVSDEALVLPDIPLR